MKIRIYTNYVGGGIELMPCFRVYTSKPHRKAYGIGIGIFGKILTLVFINNNYGKSI